MKIIAFKGYEFNPKDVTGNITCPENIKNKMVKAVLENTPEDVDVKEYSYTTSISRGNKKAVVSVWRFSLSDWHNTKPFGYFYKDGSEDVIVWGLQFYEDGKFVSNINENANIRCAMGFPLAEERKALFMLGTKAMMYVRDMAYSIKLFFSDSDSLVELVASKLPADSKIKSDAISLTAKVPVNDYIVDVKYQNGVLAVEIPHKYTDYERAYGAQFDNYAKFIKLNSAEAIENYDWDRLWDDLYEHRDGKNTYWGTLGT
jgi:hypothetical protein